MSKARTYLDHAASSPLLEVAASAMAAAGAQPGNPSSLHASGRAARRILEEARESLAANLGARPTELVFTSGGTESNNLAILGAPAPSGRDRVAISAIEHPAVSRVEPRRAVQVLPVTPTGHLDLAAARELVGVRDAIVSVMWVNNETGAIQPVSEVAELARAVGALAHSDAVQAFGHLPTDFAASGLDLLSVSAHKLGGPVGIGALVVRRGVKLIPTGFGGGQEAGIRSGTVPVALAAGFAAAAAFACERLVGEQTRLAALRDRVISVAQATIPDCRGNSVEPCSPAIANLTFGGADADDVLMLLDAAGIDASTGSACSAGVHQPSEVLTAMGRPMADAASSLRFSFGAGTREDDVDRLLRELPDAVARARTARATER